MILAMDDHCRQAKQIQLYGRGTRLYIETMPYLTLTLLRRRVDIVKGFTSSKTTQQGTLVLCVNNYRLPRWQCAQKGDRDKILCCGIGPAHHHMPRDDVLL